MGKYGRIYETETGLRGGAEEVDGTEQMRHVGCVGEELLVDITTFPQGTMEPARESVEEATVKVYNSW